MLGDVLCSVAGGGVCWEEALRSGALMQPVFGARRAAGALPAGQARRTITACCAVQGIIDLTDSASIQKAIALRVRGQGTRLRAEGALAAQGRPGCSSGGGGASLAGQHHAALLALCACDF